MSTKTILIIGYGIDEERFEAVSKNTMKHIAVLEKFDYTVHIYNIGYKNEYGNTGSSFLTSIIKRRQILKHLSAFINKQNVTHILDVFVLPLSSQLFVMPLQSQFPDVQFMKIVHNDAGFSLKLHPETFIRMVTNTNWSLNAILNSYDLVFTKNLFLAKKKNLRYIPTRIIIHPKPRKKLSRGKLSICYLGHPLKKKGIFDFLELFSILPSDLKSKLIFTFAFSDVGPRAAVIDQFQQAADKHGVTVAFEKEVKPFEFYRQHDVYVLPIHDHFGAVSTPNTILEAMEAGCLVVTNMIASLAGMFENDEVIYLENHRASSILTQLRAIEENRDQQTSRLKRARDYIEKHHSDAVVENQIESLYE